MSDTAKKIILFDGVCNLCNGVVQLIIRHDTKDQFRFASLQGKEGRLYLSKFNINDAIDSFLLIDQHKIYTRSTGALMVCRYMGSPFKYLYHLIVVPRFIRDAIYKLISQYRYRWFGKKVACMIPTPAIKSKFLDK